MKKIINLYLILHSIYCSNIFSQQLKWRVLPGVPVIPNARFEDVYFVNSLTGWIAGNGIYKTTNGGISWITQSEYSQGGIGGRCLTFIDDQIGWSGQFNRINSTSFLFKTTNGGNNWLPVNNLPVNLDSNGICGIYSVNSQVIYAIGRWSGPAIILKTTNRGNNWVSQNLRNQVTGLIDCYFFSPDSGFVVGHDGDPFTDGKPIILFTSNGGSNWDNVFTGSTTKQLCWKINFPTRLTGYVSVYSLYNTPVIIKTINAGINWVEIPNSFYSQEGIGFINETTGWIGKIGPFDASYKTTNGGYNWSADSVAIKVNKFRFFNDSLGYAAGYSIYKYSSDSVNGINQISSQIPVRTSVSQNYPNPFNPITSIRFYLSNEFDKYVKLTIYNATGKEIEILVDKKLLPGGYEISWDASNYPSGIYFYKLVIGDYSETKKMVLLK